VVIYFLVSDGDFSFFLTLQNVVQMFGFLIMVFHLWTKKTSEGLSLNAFICYAIVFVARLSSLLTYEGYLPYDSSGDWFYQTIEIFSLVLCGAVICLMHFRYRLTYNYDIDKVKWFFLAVPAFILGIMFHSNLNNKFFPDVAWAFALYLEAVAMFPQLFLLNQKGEDVEALTSHFVASQAISRLLGFVFWLFTFKELNDA